MNDDHGGEAPDPLRYLVEKLTTSGFADVTVVAGGEAMEITRWGTTVLPTGVLFTADPDVLRDYAEGLQESGRRVYARRKNHAEAGWNLLVAHLEEEILTRPEGVGTIALTRTGFVYVR